MGNTYNFKLSDFFDFVSLSAIEGVDYFIDDTTLYVNNSSTWYSNPELKEISTNTKQLCTIDLTRFVQLTSVVTEDPMLSSLQLPSSITLKNLSGYNIKVNSLSLSGSFDHVVFTTCPLLTSITFDINSSINRSLSFAYNTSLAEIVFHPNNFRFNADNIYIFLIGNNLTNETCDNLFTSLCSNLTGTSYNNIFINLTNAVTGLSSEVVTDLRSKNVTVNLTIP